MPLPYQFTASVLRFVFKPLLSALFQFEVMGLEHLKHHDNGVILAGNHTGYLDSALLLAAYPKAFRFLVREDVLKWRVVGPWVKRANTVTLYKKQQKSTMKYLIQELKRGKRFCIFPEGQLSQDGQMDAFMDGAAFLQEQSGAAIIPFAIHGGFEAWKEGQRWPKFRKITLCFGKAIAPKTKRQETTKVLSDAIQQLKDHLEGVEAFTKKRLFYEQQQQQSAEGLLATLANDCSLHNAIQFF